MATPVFREKFLYALSGTCQLRAYRNILMIQEDLKNRWQNDLQV